MKQTLRFLVTALAVLTCGITHGADPVVSNVRAAQRAGTKLVDVYYDLSGGTGASTVAVAISNDGGVSYTVPASSLSGAVGDGVAAGLNMHMVWNAGADWNGQFSSTVKFRISATTPPPIPDGFSLIPAGSFTMGRTSGDTDSNAPPVSVYLSAFFMAKYEVTKALWDEVQTWGVANGYTDLPIGQGKAANHPVQAISWYSMVKWCNARSEKEGLMPCYTVLGATYKSGNSDVVVADWSGNGYRLPTETEWEKAARGGLSGLRFPWGEAISHSQANYVSDSSYVYDVSPTRNYHPSYSSGGVPYTSPVGSFTANGYGLHDMAGNVIECCWDWSSASYYTPGASDPRGPSSGIVRIVRGGSWNFTAPNCRSSDRRVGGPGQTGNHAGFRLAHSLNATAALCDSSNFSLDTRGSGGLTVTGRTLSRTDKAGLGGTTVSLAGLSTTSIANGSFTLANVDFDASSQLVVSAVGFVPQALPVTAAVDQNVVNVGDVLLATATNKPVVERVRPDVEGILLPGFGLISTVRARVNWNGNTPATVQFRVNGTLYGTHIGAETEYSITLPVDTALRASLTNSGNLISVTATALEPGRVSDPVELSLPVVPLPAALQTGTKTSQGINLKVKFSFPATKPFGSVSLPVLGSMGGETGVAGEFSYNITSGAWTLEAGKKFGGESTKYSAFKLKLGPMQDISAEIKGKASGTATVKNGIDLSGLEITSAFGLSGKYAVGSYGPFSLLGPKLTAEVLDIPVLEEVFRAMSVILWLKPGLSAQSTFKAYPAFGFKEFSATGKTALEATYEPELGKLKTKFYVGGEPSVKFGLPGDFFRELRFKAYAGLEARAWVFKTDLRYVFVDVAYPASSPAFAASNARALGDGNLVLAAAENENASWQPMQRPWRNAGGEVFLPQEPVAAASLRDGSEAAASGGGFEAFVQMGRSSSGGTVAAEGAVAARMMVPNNPLTPVEASFPLLSNVFPDSEPSLAGQGNELLLVYLRDTGAANPVQFTEAAFSYFDGTTWTAPATISDDPRAQFSPQVVFDGAGNAVAVYERVKDAAFSGTVMADMAALMEIVWSRWDGVAKTWSAPQALTNNSYLDFSPKLSGPLADGDLLLTWNQSEANEIDGTGAAGATTNLRVMNRRWGSATQTWGAATPLVANLTGELSESLGARGNKGVYVWTVDLDGNAADSTDAELFYRLYNATTDSWGPAARHTTDAVADRHAKAVVDSSGDVYVVWNRNGDLVMDVNFAGTPTVVRSGAGTSGVSDYALTLGPASNLALTCCLKSK